MKNKDAFQAHNGPSLKNKPEDTINDLVDFVAEIKHLALQAVEKRFEGLLKKIERDFNTVLQKYKDNLVKIEARKRETGDEKQAEHDIEYARQILAKDIEDIKNEIRKNLQVN
ncbi:MAG: hypothetical protein WCT44_00090 [Candidatus Paceibacterota bacterium]